ncbi:MAG: peptidylprolyl isomerase, partial [Gemmatimonadaceae bacterium]
AYAALRFGRAGSGGAPNARALPAWIRELALLALQAANAADSSAVRLASQDPHPLVRRLALRSSDLLGGAAPQLLRGLLADRSAPVRLDAVRALAATATRAGGEPWPGACAASHRLLSDAAAHVRLEAIDAVAAACTEPVGPAGPAALDSLVKLLPRDTLDARSSWHAPARALVALSRRDGRRATAHFTRFSGHPVWQVHAALADAARSTGDTALLLRLLDDKDANVREEVIGHLAALGGELRERGVQRGLASDDYQVVLAAARAAKDVPSVAVPSLAQALARLTRHRHETSRDPRCELLERIAERGGIEHADLIRPYVTDFDTLIARRAAEVMSLWTGQLVRPQATPLPLPGEPLGDVARQRGLFLRITLSPAYGSGSFLVRLTADETPATVARIVRLARSGAYNGRTFHRVVPNFVIQGGSPDANEYVGDGPFMRDELGLRSHTRGTLGISTRGRDTGDAQIFVNVVDNFRLDHDYTVFGEVIEGMAVVDRIQTGAVMAAVEVLQRRR